VRWSVIDLLDPGVRILHGANRVFDAFGRGFSGSRHPSRRVRNPPFKSSRQARAATFHANKIPWWMTPESRMNADQWFLWEIGVVGPDAKSAQRVSRINLRL
jgi:hypothetical protein